MLRLPAYQELSSEQDAAINLPINGNYLLTGPPGTGKTVIAIYRTLMMRDSRVACNLVVYNNTLNKYLTGALSQKYLYAQTETFHRWFEKLYRSYFHSPPPEIERWKYDWNTILTYIVKYGDFLKYPNLILDEGQDFPNDFYRILRLMVENSTIFADENQRLTESNSTIEDIRKMMGIPRENIRTLKKNYRNTREIAAFACCFHTGVGGGVPELPTKKGMKPRLIMLDRQAQIDRIARYASNNRTKTTGILVSSTDGMNQIYNGLTRRFRGPVQMYYSGGGAYSQIDFRKTGIYIISYQSAKGLQFDTVFLPFLEDVRSDVNPDNLKMRLYVQVTRAGDELYLLCDGNEPPFFLKDVPEDLFNTDFSHVEKGKENG